MGFKAFAIGTARLLIALAAEQATRAELERVKAKLVLAEHQLEQVSRQRDDLAAELAEAGNRALAQAGT